jgi:transposase
MMRFSNQPHRFYCGVDLHARTLAVCVLDTDGTAVFHDTIAASPQAFLKAVQPFRDGLVVACECMFAWYWLADLCHDEAIPFVLGHALSMKAIHGGKAKTDKIDAQKVAALLRGGLPPQAYVYPRGMRATRDLLRRRTYLVRRRAEALAHLVNTNSPYNRPPLAKKLTYAANREELDLPACFADPSVQRNLAVGLALIEAYDAQIAALELNLTRAAKVGDAQAYARLRSVPGIGKVLALVLLYEIHDIRRFPKENPAGRGAAREKSPRGSARGRDVRMGRGDWKWGRPCRDVTPSLPRSRAAFRHSRGESAPGGVKRHGSGAKRPAATERERTAGAAPAPEE